MTREPASRSAASRLRLAGVVVVVVGWVAAAIVFSVASMGGDQAADGDIVGGEVYARDDASSRELRQLERLGGKAAVLTFKFNRWFTSLWTGRALAGTLAVLSLLVALACLHIAGLMEETGPPP